PMIFRRSRGPLSSSTLAVTLRLVLAVVGVAIWAYGARIDDSALRWAGIAFLAVAVATRFLRWNKPPPD
ncbi:MAG: hypothetical protein ACR2G6_02015, partial [Gemmatimonadaceae bacterium]